ncbi:MAG: Clp1/GlmU family protein [Candidatus Bathyarchaeia archaeon]|jgi:polynucleotide 5'-hydroxyl-kinase GRC3/NOL9
MKQTIEAGKTLLVNGPASVKVLSGKAEVFGYTIKESQQAIVREGKRQPFHVLENAEFHISLGANAAVMETEASTIPASWSEPLQAVRTIQEKPVVVVVLGKADSGKSSFSTYIVNRLVDGNSKVAVLDGDLGQSDIGAPCTVAYGYTTKKVTEISELKVSNAFFVGVNSPVQAVARTIEGVVAMLREILQKAEADYVVINTDGWVEGELAVKYKLQLVNQLKPDLVIGIQIQEELKPLLSSLNTVPTFLVESSKAVSERNPEKRTKLRELNYAKHLKDAKVRSLFSSYMEIQEKNVLPKEPGKEKGILVGLRNSRKRFLGIGILLEFNRARRVMKVLTPVSSKPASIAIGKIRLDPELKEEPL